MNKYRVFISETHPIVIVEASHVDLHRDGSRVFYEREIEKRGELCDHIVAVYPSTVIVELIP